MQAEGREETSSTARTSSTVRIVPRFLNRALFSAASAPVRRCPVSNLVLTQHKAILSDSRAFAQAE